MANARQKKKKKNAAAKQAAAAYKGKNAPIKAAPVKKPQEKQTLPEPENKKIEPEKNKPDAVEVAKIETGKSECKKNEVKAKESEKVKKPKPAEKKTDKTKSKPVKASKSKPQKKRSKKSAGSLTKQLKSRIEAFGVNKFAAIVLAVSVVITAVCVIAWVTSSRFGIPDDAIPEYKGKNISSDLTLYVLEDLSAQHEFADKMDRKGDTKKFRYYAADELVFPEKNSQAALNLVNVSDNNCVIIASIVDDTGNICYSSRGLPAGWCLTDIGINDRPYGTHEMKLVVAAYDPETYELIGVQSSDLTVQVGIEEETSDVTQTQG